MFVVKISYCSQALSFYCISPVGQLVLGLVGKNLRVILLSCAVAKIRDKFPSVDYAGFKYPAI